jgi:DNA polymerase-3 subunit gamma/tau
MSEKSKVLALKYRPKIFEELIGQKVVSETIINSIKADKIPNAYLFTGIRGIGKTTIARIVAKSLNCLNGIEKLCEKNLCINCEGISKSTHMDVLELNGADKTSIDDIRDLIEFSRYGPTSSKYKIFIIDEVHQISSSAFNALLKILEEPPNYLKFILATTEIKKVPVTIISRCQRFDLSRVKSEDLFQFIKKVKNKENGNVSDDALKLIVKISEGSVRDALSLLDRGLLSLNKQKELDLSEAQKIFGYFDKSQLIEMFDLVLQGDEKKVLEIYRKIFDQGINPKVFINDFLELIYYFKNINSLTLESTNFSLNDEEFSKIKNISNSIDNRVLILFWQFTIKTIEELEVVSNQNLAIEMYLIRLIYLSSLKQRTDLDNNEAELLVEKDFNYTSKNDVVDQIKNITQEKKIKPESDPNIKAENRVIDTFKNLLEICNEKKEIKLKYELEKNVSLVNFERNRIEISFNENLDKFFVKELSSKLYEWTGERWIISFSKEIGQMSIKQQADDDKKKLIDDIKKTQLYNDFIKKFPDAYLNDVIWDKKKEDK